MHRGYVKLWRRLSDSDFWLQEKFTKAQAWIDLIMLANHKDGFIRKRGIRVDLKRGDIGWSEAELSKRWKWSRGKVRRFLSELSSEKEQKIVQQNGQQNKFLTHCYRLINYDLYQGDGQQNGQQTVQQTDSKRTANGTGTRMTKNEKNEKNTYSSDFLSFWKLYPRKRGKGAAFKSWQKIPKSNGLIENIMQAVAQHKKCEQWQKDNGQFIPNPATWLNQRRWEDEITEVENKNQKPKGLIEYERLLKL